MGCGASRTAAVSHSPRSLSAADPLACGEFRRFVKATTAWDESPQGPLLIEFIDALDNLHLTDQVTVRNVSDDSGAAADLTAASGGGQAPCLVIDGNAMLESADVILELARRAAPI